MKNLLFTTLFVVFVAVTAACVPNKQPKIISDPNASVRVDESLTPAELNLNEKRAVIAEAYAKLDSEFGKDGQPPKEFPIISNYHKVFVTFIGDNRVRCCQSGKGKEADSNPSQTDISTATKKCIGDDRFGGETKKSEVVDTEIIATYLYNKREVKGGLKAAKKNIELGVHSIEVEQGSDNAYYKASVPIKSNLSHKKALKKLCKKAGLSKKCYDEPATRIYMYDTLEFKGNRNGDVVDLSRQNVLFSKEEIDEDMVNERLLFARDWFVNNTNEDTGMIEYAYYPSKDEYSDDNNHVRQLATIWAVATLRNYFNDKSLNDLIYTTLDHYLQYKKCEKDHCYLDIDGKTKLGYSAFVILALLEAKEYPNSEEIREEFARGVLYQQQEDGSYRTYFNSDKMSGEAFYPGEAMLAIMKLYKETGDKKYLQSVGNAVPYYMDYWNKSKSILSFIPWHSQAQSLYYEETKDRQVAEFIFKINDYLIDKFQVRESPYKDEIGGFPPLKPCFLTQTDAEGTIDAYRVAKLYGDKQREIKYKESLINSFRFIFLSQHIPENSFYLKHPNRAIGGFRQSLTTNTQRLDFTQHAVLAMLKALENGVLE